MLLIFQEVILQTRLELILNIIYRFALRVFYKNFVDLSFSILSMLLGFFMSNTLSTIPGQTGDWGITGAAIIATFYEMISKKIYTTHVQKQNSFLLAQVNSVKVGVIYGFFVDAFKLGS